MTTPASATGADSDRTPAPGAGPDPADATGAGPDPADPSDAGRAATATPGIVGLAATLLVGAIAALLDMTIVAVALDQIRRDLAAPLAVVGWVTTGYVLAMTAVIPLVGWAVGRYGARRMWTVALLGFLLGSVLAGLAWSVGALIAFRVVQGLGGGMILPLTQLALARAAGPDRLGRVMSVVGTVGQVAPITGPVLGGLLVDTAGWRWIFFANVPVVLISLAMARRWLPPDTDTVREPLDVPGVVLLPTGVVALLYALSRLDADPVTVTAGLVGAALLAGFVVRGIRRGGGLVDLGLFRNRSFAAGAVMMVVLGVTTWGPMFLLPLYYQEVRGLSGFDTGMVLALQSVGLAVAFLVAGRYADRVAPRRMAVAGMAVAALATVPFVVPDPSGPSLAVALLVRGIGFGVGSLPVTVALYRTLPAADIPGATTAGNVLQRIGAATGTAVMAVAVAATGFGSALAWMLGLSVAALAASMLLPDRA